MSDNQNWMIETIDLTRIYGDGEKIFALNQVNLRVSPGELVAIMGPSGSGKSTLLNVIGALDLPTSGEVFVNGQDIVHLRNKDDFRAKTVGFVFQLHNLLPTLNSIENIEVPMMGHRPPWTRRKRAKELLELVHLEDRGNHLPGQLSGGQRQRVAVARALANDPPLVLADEPTGNLDTVAGEELMKLLHELNKSQGTTFIVVTHDLNVARQTRRVIVMADGGIVREDVIGSPIEEDLKVWSHTGLGRRILENDQASLAEIGISMRQAATVREILVKNSTESHQVPN
jgi:ABC-type lipoprotein export system ATPase subunit